jgi:ribose 1,5-bisphosphokinase
MSWIVDTRAFAGPRDGAIGPGRLVLVVGPSGAGKDTLIRGARESCLQDQARNPSIVFPRRVVTRPPSQAEDNDTISDEGFAQAVADGAFALWWDAHGHRYGISSSIDGDIRAGRAVVCNVSRAIVREARQRYADVAVVLVTAPDDVLAARLADRNRASDGDIAARVKRATAADRDYEPDVTIQNVGDPDHGVRMLLKAIRKPAIVVID